MSKIIFEVSSLLIAPTQIYLYMQVDLCCAQHDRLDDRIDRRMQKSADLASRSRNLMNREIPRTEIA